MIDEARLAKLEKGIEELRKKLEARRAELRKREFDKLPAETRKAFETVGWSPYQEGQVVYRECGSFRAN